MSLIAVFTQVYCTYYNGYGKCGFRLKTTSKYIVEQKTQSVDNVKQEGQLCGSDGWWWCGDCAAGLQCLQINVSKCGKCIKEKGGLNK